jgi:hypothetical protein
VMCNQIDSFTLPEFFFARSKRPSAQNFGNVVLATHYLLHYRL